MADHISPWEILSKEAAEKSRAAFEYNPEFQSLLDEAARRGFRRITLLEQMSPGQVDAFTWRGGVWVKTIVRR